MDKEREEYLADYCANKNCTDKNGSECDNCMYEKGREDEYHELFGKYSKLLEEVKINKGKAENIIDDFINWCFDHADYDLHITSDQQLYEYLLKLFGVWKEKHNGNI